MTVVMMHPCLQVANNPGSISVLRVKDTWFFAMDKSQTMVSDHNFGSVSLWKVGIRRLSSKSGNVRQEEIMIHIEVLRTPSISHWNPLYIFPVG